MILTFSLKKKNSIKYNNKDVTQLSLTTDLSLALQYDITKNFTVYALSSWGDIINLHILFMSSTPIETPVVDVFLI